VASDALHAHCTLPELAPPQNAGAAAVAMAGETGRRAGMATAVEIQAAMTDIVYVAVAVAFFGLAWAYARACDRL
jgi:hypothetical protein